MVNVFASLWFNPSHDTDMVTASMKHMVATVADPNGNTALYFRQILTNLLESKKSKAATTFPRYIQALFSSK